LVDEEPVVDVFAHEPDVIAAYREGVTVLAVVGEHDMASVDKIESMIGQQARSKRNIVVSLKDTSFIDSTVVATLLRAHREADEEGRRLVLHTDCGADILKLLELTGVPQVVPCAQSLDDAIVLARGD
jgi:anti-anti-sigma factor